MKPTYAPKGSLIAAVDIGSFKTACFIARTVDDQGNLKILGVGHHLSKGVKNGMITDMDAAEAIIRKAVHAAEHMAKEYTKGYPLREVIVNIPASQARSYGRTIDININSHEVTERDLKSAIKEAQDDITALEQKGSSYAIGDQILGATRKLIHTIPVGYRIDGNGGINDPIGMVGQNFSADIHIISSDKSMLKNIKHCMDQSHLDIAAYCIPQYAAGLASLVQDEMDLGCTVIDIGGGMTSFAVFHAGHMIYSDAIPVGGQHVTNDIAAGLTTSFEDAERIKILYGSAMATDTDESELIDVPKLGENNNRTPNHVPRSLLIGIIQPRLEEIFELLRARLNDSGLQNILGRRVVLTGGCSQIPGIKDLANHVLDKQIRIGHPIRHPGLPDAVDNPAFATTAGLLTYGASHIHEISDQYGKTNASTNIFQTMTKWLQENW